MQRGGNNMNFVLVEVIEREISAPSFFDTYQEAYDQSCLPQAHGFIRGLGKP
jgi:hypothetical protein